MSVQDISSAAKKVFESDGDIKPIVIMMLDTLAKQEQQIQSLENNLERFNDILNGAKVPSSSGGYSGLSIG